MEDKKHQREFRSILKKEKGSKGVIQEKEKRCWMERKVEEIKQANRRNDSRKFYKGIER
jgi:hypothetical protein